MHERKVVWATFPEIKTRQNDPASGQIEISARDPRVRLPGRGANLQTRRCEVIESSSDLLGVPARFLLAFRVLITIRITKGPLSGPVDNGAI